MIDTSIEIEFTKQAALLTNAGYFDRYRVHLAAMNCRLAWEQVEKELPFGLRRFTTYDSFKKALRQERRRELSQIVRLQVV